MATETAPVSLTRTNPGGMGRRQRRATNGALVVVEYVTPAGPSNGPRILSAKLECYRVNADGVEIFEGYMSDGVDGAFYDLWAAATTPA